MSLYDVPLILILIGLMLYTVLAGADFGAGIWQLTAGGGDQGQEIREHAHESMAPVWEANHVWLVFVLTVLWSAYPIAFGSIASTLSIPLFIGLLGIVLRGAAYALRAGARSAKETRAIDTLFAISSLIAPFALGTCIGGIAAGRVPVGNASGHLFSSWLNLTSVTIGALAVASAAYLAAIYLSADAARLKRPAMVSCFRRRALIAGAIAGAIAIVGVFVLHEEVPRLYSGLVSGDGLPALIVSLAAGVCTLGLVWWRRFAVARFTAALAVAAIIAGWALAQQPRLLAGLTVAQAAAPHQTLVLVVIVVLGGGAILFPSLALLFGLLLRGKFDPRDAQPQGAPIVAVALASREGLLARSAVVALIAGAGLIVFAEAAWGEALGVLCLAGFVLLGFAAAKPTELAKRG